MPNRSPPPLDEEAATLCDASGAHSASAPSGLDEMGAGGAMGRSLMRACSIGGSLDELVRSRSISASMEARVKAPVPQPPPTPSPEMVVANKGSWCMPGRGGARSVELTAGAPDEIDLMLDGEAWTGGGDESDDESDDGEEGEEEESEGEGEEE